MKSICGGCGLIFTCITAFDKHRIGEYRKQIYAVNAQGKPTGKIIALTPDTRRCLTVAELQTIGMIPDERGWWKETMTEEQKANLEAFMASRVLSGKGKR